MEIQSSELFPGMTLAPASPGLWTTIDVAVLVLLGAGVPLLAVEVWGLWSRGRLDRARVSGMLTSLFCMVPATAVDVLAGAAFLALYVAVGELAPWSIPVTWATALTCLVLADLAYYWDHRISHEVGTLWATYHSVHHSADHYDQTIGVRISFTDHLLNVPFHTMHLGLVLVGFDPYLVLACALLVLSWQQWIHTETVGRLPWLDGWLNTPSNHRVHHGRNPEYVDRNYGGILMVWDRLFGTWAPEEGPVDYGLVEPLQSRHPWKVHFHLLEGLVRRVAGARDLREAWHLLTGPPAILKAPPSAGSTPVA